MDPSEVILNRRSIRNYRPDPLPEALVRELLAEARWAPSWRNTQAWHAWVLTGPRLERFKTQFTRSLIEDAPSRPDLDMPGRDIPPVCTARTKRLMATREATETAAGIDCSREGKLTRMGELFGAPCLIVVGVDQSIAQAYAGFDCGCFVQTLCLAAEEKGLGTCIMATAVRFPQILHEMLRVPPGMLMVVGVALGYPDPDAVINTFPRERAGLDELVSWAK